MEMYIKEEEEEIKSDVDDIKKKKSLTKKVKDKIQKHIPSSYYEHKPKRGAVVKKKNA